MKTNNDGTHNDKFREVSYYHPALGRTVTKKVRIPDPVKVKDLNGMGVEEISSKEDLEALWSQDILSDVVTPLTSHSRQILVGELKKVLNEGDEHDAIDMLANSWTTDDDRALKLIGRLIAQVHKQRRGRGRSVNKIERLLHEKELWNQEKQRLKQENENLHTDVRKLVNERDDALRRAQNARNTIGGESLAHRTLHKKVESLEQELKDTIVERDVLQRDAQRNIELALTEYETEVMGKLGSVAADHKVAVEDLKNEQTKNKELTEQVENLRVALAGEMAKNTQVPKGSVTMSDVQQNETQEQEALRPGDEVFCKISNEGPFVLITQVEEGTVKYSNPVPGVKNHFNVGEVTVNSPWLVRDGTGSMRCLPAPVLTKQSPKRRMSFDGIKGVITSDVTSKLFQAAIWVTMLTLLAMKHVG